MKILEIADTSFGRYGIVEDELGVKHLWFAREKGTAPVRLYTAPAGVSLHRLVEIHEGPDAEIRRHLVRAAAKPSKKIRGPIGERARFDRMLKPSDAMVGWWAHRADLEE